MGCGYDVFTLNDHVQKLMPYKINSYFCNMEVVLYLLGPVITFKA